VKFPLRHFLPPLLAVLVTHAQEPHRPAAAENSPALFPAAHTAPPALSTSPSDLAAGGRLFQIHCALCHGPRGEGGKGPTLALPSLPRATDDTALRRIISSGLTGTEMPGSQLPAPAIAQLAAFVKSLGQLPPERIPGDPARGAQLYATKGACATCHSIHGRGHSFGPDLTVIGQRRSAAYLRRALTEPSADVPQSSTPYRSDVSLPENFLFVRAVTRDGRALAGIRLNEDAFSLQIRDAAGRIHSVFKSDLAEFHRDRGFSPMPAYGAVFTSPEIDDLVAYLVSLRGQK
jgi:cytochrome c oxidase cbb3-type subunit 3